MTDLERVYIHEREPPAGINHNMSRPSTTHTGALFRSHMYIPSPPRHDESNGVRHADFLIQGMGDCSAWDGYRVASLWLPRETAARMHWQTRRRGSFFLLETSHAASNRIARCAARRTNDRSRSLDVIGCFWAAALTKVADPG